MIKDIKTLASSAKSPDQTIAALAEAVASLTQLVKLILLDKQLDQLNGQVTDITGIKPKNQPNLQEALDNLEEFTTVRRLKDGKREFLLHRLTADFEYQGAQEGNQYVLSERTYWAAEAGVVELEQDRSEAALRGANPAVSCFIPESSIEEIGGAQPNTGTHEAGSNPHKNKYEIAVKPGKYELYMEVKE